MANDDPWKENLHIRSIPGLRYRCVDSQGQPSREAFNLLGFAMRKLGGMEGTRKNILFPDGTLVYMSKEDRENPRIEITVPAPPGGVAYLKESEYEIQLGLPDPLFEIFTPPFYGIGGSITWDYFLGYLWNQDRLKTGKGQWIDKKYEKPPVPPSDGFVTSDLKLNHLAGDFPIFNQPVLQMEPESVVQADRFQGLAEFSTTLVDEGGSVQRIVADENPDYWIQWDSANNILSFPGVTLPAFPNIDYVENGTPKVGQPSLKSPRILKYPVNAKVPEPVYLYNIIYQPETIG